MSNKNNDYKISLSQKSFNCQQHSSRTIDLNKNHFSSKIPKIPHLSLSRHLLKQRQQKESILTNFKKSTMTVSEKFKSDLKHLQRLVGKSLKSYHIIQKQSCSLKYQLIFKKKFDVISPKSFSSRYVSSQSSSPNCNNLTNQDHYSRKRHFIINKEALIKQAKAFYSKSALSGNILHKVDSKQQLQIYNQHLIILLESTQYYHKKYLADKSFIKPFCNMKHTLQVKANILIEELCTLIIQILQIILCDIYETIEEIIFSKVPCLHNYSLEICTNELEIFESNIMLYNEVINYLELCMEVIKIMIKKVKFISLSIENRNMLPIYLDRARFKISNLIAMAECYIKKTNDDITILRDFEEGIELIPKQQKPPHEIKFISDCKIIGKCKDPVIAKIKRIQSVLSIGSKERNIKPMLPKWQINKSLSQGTIKRNNINSVLHSSLLTKIIKYADDSVREKIIS